MFPTTVIGSLPRTEWVRELILDRKAGKISEEDADQQLDRAIESAILLQERAGLEEITDGEWRRESGFSPSVQNPMDQDEAYLKLNAMCQAAEMLRAKYS